MLAILHLLGTSVDSLFKSRCRLEVENLFLWHQLNVALRRAPRHLRLRGKDRALLVWMTWLWPRLERHLQRILTLYSLYYNETRTHLGLEKDAPLRRPPNDLGLSSSHRSCPALHHRNARI
jgi:hypothetical protein